MLWREFAPSTLQANLVLHFFAKERFITSLRILNSPKTMKCWLAHPQHTADCSLCKKHRTNAYKEDDKWFWWQQKA